MLSSRSERRNEENWLNSRLRICKICHDSFEKPSKDSNPTRFSIAIGLLIGEILDHLKDETYSEIWLTSLATVTPPIFTFYRGKHNSLRCHGIVFNSNPYEMVGKLDKVREGQSIFW